MNAKLATIIVLFMAVLNLVPPLFIGTEYHDNVYYCIMYLLLSYIALVLPFLVHKLNRLISAISMMLGGWFASGLVFELINLLAPNKVLNSMKQTQEFNSMLLMFIIGIAFIITHESWKKQRN